MIDFVGPSSSKASTTYVVELDESGQVLSRVHLERAVFSNNKTLYKTVPTRDPRLFAAPSQNSSKSPRQILTSVQSKERRLESRHPIPQPDFKDEEIVEDIWPAESTFLPTEAEEMMQKVGNSLRGV